MIHHVRIRNYKSLADVSVDLLPVTVIIGRSGTGKTNFVEALRFVRDIVAHREIQRFSALLSGSRRWLCANATAPATFSIEITFSGPLTAENYRYSFSFSQDRDPHINPHQPLTLRYESLVLGERVLFTQKDGKWETAPQLVTPMAPNGLLMLGNLTGLPEVLRAFVLLNRGIGWYSFSDNVLFQGIADQNQAIRHIGSGQGQSETGLSDNAENYRQVFNAIVDNVQSWSQQEEMIASLRKIDPSILSVQPNMPERDRIFVGHQIRDKILPLDLDQESEGMRRFLAYLLALYQIPPKQTLLFEEPEKGIHPGALALLAEELSACPEAGRGQVILTTHSPDLLNHFPPDVLRVTEIKDGATRIAPLRKDQLESVRENLLRTGELLTVDEAQPEAPAAAGA